MAEANRCYADVGADSIVTTGGAAAAAVAAAVVAVAIALLGKCSTMCRVFSLRDLVCFSFFPLSHFSP